jgi:hypothetical protein
MAGIFLSLFEKDQFIAQFFLKNVSIKTTIFNTNQPSLIPIFSHHKPERFNES